MVRAWCVHVPGACMARACACCSMPASEAASFASLGFMRLAEAKFSVAWLGLGLGLGLVAEPKLASAYECAMHPPCIHHASTMHSRRRAGGSPAAAAPAWPAPCRPLA
eukprot:scaffold104358_cov64-Phaeocystis_antarctica.AAC.1